MVVKHSKQLAGRWEREREREREREIGLLYGPLISINHRRHKQHTQANNNHCRAYFSALSLSLSLSLSLKTMSLAVNYCWCLLRKNLFSSFSPSLRSPYSMMMMMNSENILLLTHRRIRWIFLANITRENPRRIASERIQFYEKLSNGKQIYSRQQTTSQREVWTGRAMRKINEQVHKGQTERQWMAN